MNIKHKDQAHLKAVSLQGIAVLLAGIGVSAFNAAVAEAVLIGGGVIVLANAWFAWSVRNINETLRILALHLVRFLLYGSGLATVIFFWELDPLTCVLTMVVAHMIYVLAAFRLGATEGNFKPATIDQPAVHNE